MARSKERNELELLRSENRKLKAENRNLKKYLSRHEKRQYLYEDLEVLEADILLEQDTRRLEVIPSQKCPMCKGKVEVIGGDKRSVHICQSCGYRTSKKS